MFSESNLRKVTNSLKKKKRGLGLLVTLKKQSIYVEVFSTVDHEKKIKELEKNELGTLV